MSHAHTLFMLLAAFWRRTVISKCFADCLRWVFCAMCVCSSPQYVHCANYSGEWNEAALHTLAKQQFVVFEKYHKAFEEPQLDQAEAKIAESCRKVKEINPDTDCYIYTESDWARTEYSLGQWFLEHNESALQCDSPNNLEGKFVYTNDTLCNDWPPPPDGQQLAARGGEMNGCNGKLHHLTYLAYDFNNSEAREKWIERVTNVTATGHVDGAFIDGNRGGFGSGIIGSCSAEKKAGWVSNRFVYVPCFSLIAQ